MTLETTINKLLKIAKKQPNINYVGEGDIYKLDHLPNVEYGVFFVTQTSHSLEDDILKVNLNLFYVDRLLNDGSNTLKIQSNGISILTDIINTFVNSEDAEIDGGITFNTFTHRFTADCAGVYATITFNVDNEINDCYE